MSVVMTPREIVQELDKHIIGQNQAKRAVAIAMRNRWRRMQIEDAELRDEIMPKNILMIGPTGVGKTEIARRLARLANAPFIKVEATKYTEVGYVGGDVQSIIRDLMDISIKQAREEALAKVKDLTIEAAEERILNALLPRARTIFSGEPKKGGSEEAKGKETGSATRQTFLERLRKGELDETEIEIDIAASPIGVEIMVPHGMEEMTSQLQNMFQSLGSGKTKTRKMKVKEAFKVLREDEASKLINENKEEIQAGAIENVEQNGIVFIDEIDKVTRRSEHSGGDVSREGVQRDLLPLVEGCTVFTKHGMIKTDHILFIASGAFHAAKPSDMIAELQGRLPIRVELAALTTDDFICILTETEASLTEQYSALLGTEGLQLSFTADGVKRIAEVAWQVNESTENIGARRLYTVMERLLETISFEAADRNKEKIKVNAKYVNKYLDKLVKDENLARYIL